MKQYFRFSLRTLLLAVTVWSVLLAVSIRLGFVEALEVLMLGAGIIVLLAYLHREALQERRWAAACGVLAHVLATPAILMAAHIGTRGGATWWGVACWCVAGVLMFPLALLHHLVCWYNDWYWGLSQPGTFFLIVVLNSMLWIEARRWRQRKSVA